MDKLRHKTENNLSVEEGQSRLTAVLALPGVQLLDVAGPLDVFGEANRQLGDKWYQTVIIGLSDAIIESSSGVKLVADRSIENWQNEEMDTVLVAGGVGIPSDSHIPPSVLTWLQTIATQTRRFGSICNGAFLLAEAGLLNGRAVTTHWATASQLAGRFPEVQVEPDAFHISEGKLHSAAGVTAGLDLALLMVEADHGRELARKVAAQLVMLFRRTGSQKQFSYQDQLSLSALPELQSLQRWCIGNLRETLDTAVLAKRMNITARHLSRLFQAEVGKTPAKWVESIRVHHAVFLLEQGILAPKQIADSCGFSSMVSMRRVFMRNFGLSPTAWRKAWSGKN